MHIENDSYQCEFLFTELAGVVGREHVSTSAADKIAYSCDYYWVAELWIDRGRTNPTPDFVVHPATADEVAGICRIANNYKNPLNRLGRRFRLARRRAAHARRNCARHQANEQDHRNR